MKLFPLLQPQLKRNRALVYWDRVGMLDLQDMNNLKEFGFLDFQVYHPPVVV